MPSTPFRLLVISSLCSLGLSVTAQEKAVEYETTQLSDTVSMLKGQGGNIGLSAGEDGVFLVDDQLKLISDQLLAVFC